MNIDLSTTHAELSADTKSKISEKVTRSITKYQQYITHIHLVIDHDKHHYIVEAIIQLKGRTIQAKNSGDTCLTAVDGLMDKTGQQLAKYKEQLVSHRD